VSRKKAPRAVSFRAARETRSEIHAEDAGVTRFPLGQKKNLLIGGIAPTDTLNTPA
jgi:hypothetical protein